MYITYNFLCHNFVVFGFYTWAIAGKLILVSAIANFANALMLHHILATALIALCSKSWYLALIVSIAAMCVYKVMRCGVAAASEKRPNA